MARVVSIWLPFWRTDRLERPASGGIRLHEALPFAIVAKGKGGKRLLALNAAARETGLRPGMLLTDACAILPTLAIAPHDPQAEGDELKRLAASCNRFSPWTAPDAPDGIWIEATGLAHLFGGEQPMLRAILSYLHELGFAARAALAGTAGAAWGLARYSKAVATIVPPGDEAEAIAPLPVKALRIDADSAALLNRLGLKTVGQILDIPRASLRARLGTAITCRLDQALGHEGEALSPLMPEPVYAARIEFADPLTAFEGLERTVRILIGDVAQRLKADGKGARRFSLMLFDTENGTTKLSVRMTRSSCEPRHIVRVFKERLTALEGRFDVHLGFDAAALYAMRAEPIQGRQTDLLGGACDDGGDSERIAQFLDRVSARLGEKAASRFAFEESHWPEHAAHQVSATATQTQRAAAPDIAATRPLMLLPRPEPIDVIALVPDYPPRKFVWRRRHHKIARAEGPERISPEWWRGLEGAEKIPPARDYYVVEDEDGQRFWLFREGVYGKSEEQRWFLHGRLP